MIYITGDTHGKFEHINRFVERIQPTLMDTMIILGDVGLNYYLDSSDVRRKKQLSKMPLTFFCLKGNHEKHADVLPQYEEVQFWGATAYLEPQFPNIIFAKDGEIYDIPNYGTAFVMGGAYSVDKYYRLEKGYPWFDTEQPSEETKKIGFKNLVINYDWKVDYILTHTCPARYEPTEWFLPIVDQDTVDKTTEQYLDIIESTTIYKKWYCGHYHGNKKIDKVQFLFNDIVELERVNS